jgi:asparagine synthase (glutamine-hydrolysing)
MCGIVAFFESGRSFPAELLNSAERDLFHRGPDGGGQHSEPGAALVFRRLSIIDPHARSNQPLFDRTERYVLIFNGEIYNYRALRQELMAAGVPLRTEGDSEVIVEGFGIWGEAVFGKLEGMFAIVLYDRQMKQVWATRDPLGIKPLYVARKGTALGLASEMRPLRRFLEKTEVDHDALAELLVFRFAAGRLSNLKGIELLPGGRYLRYSLSDGKMSESTFADLGDTFAEEPTTLEAALDSVEDALVKSVALHLQSDVGYAIQLSGGVDSSLVLAMATKRAGRELDSYGIRLAEAEYDESQFRAQVIAQYGAHHNEVDLGAIDFADALPRAVEAMEGPVPHFGCTMLMLLCGEIRKRHKVVLTGEGADEFFGGYDRYARWRELRRYGWLAKLVPEPFWPLLRRYESLRRFSRFDAAIVSSVYFDFLAINKLFPTLVPRPGARERIASHFSDFRDRMLAIDQSSYLASLLMRQDRMAMAEGVEARVPFAHFPLAKALNRLPRAIRIPGNETKPLLKAIARRWLPKPVVDRRKIGLTLPLGDWLKNSRGFGRYLDLLTEPDCRLAAYGERATLKRWVDEFRNSEPRSGVPPLAHLVNVEVWLRSLDAPLCNSDETAKVTMWSTAC